MMTQRKPTRTTGLAHLIAATGYSLAGLRRLWLEASFRQEVLGGLVGVVALAALGATAQSVAIFVMLLLALLTVEALNTAIEVIVDHLSPDWSDFGKQAKDVGSAAVFLMILVNAIWFLATIIGLWSVPG
jgi:diacylglycerol kinase (ATP)